MTDYTRIHRLIRILTLVQSGPGWNAPRLAKELSVTERSVYRDLKALEDTKVPLVFDERTDGYRIAGDFFLPPVHLTGDEALALTLLCEHIAGKDQIGMMRPAWKAMAKVRALLPAELRKELEALAGAVTIQTAAAAQSDAFADVYEKVRLAIATRTSLECQYESLDRTGAKGKGSAETFLFNPYGLFFSVRSWYAVGYHGARREVRSLKLSRFIRVQATGETYRLPEDFSIEKVLGNAWQMVRGKKDVQVELEFDAAFGQNIVDTQWHRTQEIEEHDDGRITFRCTVSGLDEIVWWVLARGPHCRVVKPRELAERVRELAQQTVGMYK